MERDTLFLRLRSFHLPLSAVWLAIHAGVVLSVETGGSHHRCLEGISRMGRSAKPILHLRKNSKQLLKLRNGKGFCLREGLFHFFHREIDQGSGLFL